MNWVCFMNMHVLRTPIMEILKFLKVVFFHRGQLSHTHTHTHIMLHVLFHCTKTKAVMLIKKWACSCWYSVCRPPRTLLRTKGALFSSKKLQFHLHQLAFASSTSSSSNSQRTYFTGKSIKNLGNSYISGAQLSGQPTHLSSCIKHMQYPPIWGNMLRL